MAAVLQQFGKPVDLSFFKQFYDDKAHLYKTYKPELTPSYGPSFRCIRLFDLAGKHAETEQTKKAVASQMDSDGFWPADKWHASWLYNALCAAYAYSLDGAYEQVLKKTAHAIRSRQASNGSWNDTQTVRKSTHCPRC